MNRPTAARSWGIITTALGAAMLIQPAAVAGFVSGGASTPPTWIVRVLGGRQLVQGVAVAIRPDSHLLLTSGSVVDALHTASMVAVARWWPRYRRPALASAAVAGTSAVAGGLLGRLPQPSPR